MLNDFFVQKGRIEFVDLVLKEEVFRVQVPSAVASIELLGKTSARATYLLVSCHLFFN